MIFIISDVSVGYGTPQLLRLAESLVEKYSSHVVVIEPDQSERPPIKVGLIRFSEKISIKRVFTATHPNSLSGTVEYILIASEIISAFQVDLVIFSSERFFPILELIKPSKSINIFYCLEHVQHSKSLNYELFKEIDIFIFPEENRRRIYMERISELKKDYVSLIIFNSNSEAAITPPEKNGRIFYGGTFHKDLTFGGYYLNDPIKNYPIDIYGIIDGFENYEDVYRQLTADPEKVFYKGYLPSGREYFERLSSYYYSIISWAPNREDRYYACPNKLFDAIACGVPPISAPHPQCVEIIRKYSCGIIMDDWSQSSFQTAINVAARISKSAEYEDLVRNCALAMEDGLSWPRQVAPLFDELWSRGFKPSSRS
jgi:glycosyltransferase involved in cell wall biosynthesis